MKRTTLVLVFSAAAAFLPTSAPAQNDALKERMEELRRRREERRKEAQQRAAQGGAPAAQAGAPAARAGAATQGGSTSKAQGGAAGKTQAGATGKGGSGGAAGAATGTSAIETLRATRAERRKVTLERLRERWGPLLGDVRAREELRVHAERLAQLQRVRSLAEEKKKVKVIEQVDAVITKEELRHASAMNALRTGTPTAAGKP